MGILGLLPLLKDIQVKTSISSFKGQTVGIDAYCWLHKGTYGCAKDVVLGQPTKVYIQYVMRRVNMLINYDITPILVFDGGHLPAKSEKEKERREKRIEYRARALEALRNGNSKEAFESFQKCCDITPEMAANVIQACFEMNVQCIVAPYEADAQLAFLMKSGITQLTISEDSDLLLYGCNKVLYKMSSEGDGMLVDIDNLSKVRSVQLSSFTLDNFRQMCMLSGCDYLPSIKGMGLKKAHQALKRHSNIKQCIRSFKCNPQYSVPDEYEDNFRKAELVFKYQLVFDPIRKCIVPLNEPDEELNIEDTHYCGPKITDDLALNIALGNIDPISHKRLLNLTDFASGPAKKVTHLYQNFDSQQQWLAASKGESTIQKKNINSSKLRTQENKPKDSLFGLPNKSTTKSLNQNKCIVENDDLSLSKECTMKIEASKSLKRLRSPGESPIEKDKWSMLYEKDLVENHVHHHSVFNSKKNMHKFKNPFRQDSYNCQLTKSRYFSSNAQETVDKKQKLAEPLLFESDSCDSLSCKSCSCNILSSNSQSCDSCSCDILSSNSQSYSSCSSNSQSCETMIEKGIELNTSQDLSSQNDFDNTESSISYYKRTLKMGESVLPINEKNIFASNCKDASISYLTNKNLSEEYQEIVNFNKDSFQENAVDSNSNIFIQKCFTKKKLIEETATKKDLIEETTSKFSKQTNFKYFTKKNSFEECERKNSFSEQTNEASYSHISKMLNSFKRDKNIVLSNKCIDQISVDLTVNECCDEEPLSILKNQTEKVSPIKRVFSSSRCKSIGLSRNKTKKPSMSKFSTDFSKQTKINFDKFEFRRSLTIKSEDVLCVT
ncbi:exonuclease 1 isoform X1 [Hydra vulgaris]|uniref:exonuclease 1 isoform X1 n=1 Tax=Hydra vulgaris TaxID=6087 RepID=UPI001F5E9BA8|nr:exonuclease 1 [Hydra vulgaris]